MARKKSQFPKWTGVVAKPIKTGFDPAIAVTSLDAFKQMKLRLYEEQQKKLPELARQLGVVTTLGESADEVTKLFFEREFLRRLATTLAERAGIPGFQHQRPARWPDQFIVVLIGAIEAMKHDGKTVTDFAVCLDFIQATEEGYRGRLKLPAAKKAARQLCNRISKMRATARRLTSHRNHTAANRKRPQQLH